jgi:putative hydrolase of the HAD superfamily
MGFSKERVPCRKDTCIQEQHEETVIMTKPAAVIFDMDGVLCRYDKGRRIADLAHLGHLVPAEIEARIWRSGFDEEGDAGHFTADEYLAEFNRRLGADFSREQWFEASRAGLVHNGAVLAIARNLAKQTKVAILTNNGPLLKEGFAQVFPQAAGIFGRNVFFSCEFKMIKPDPALFLAITERLGVPPALALFSDDSERHVAGARQAGLQAHHFETAEGLVTWIESFGLKTT